MLSCASAPFIGRFVVSANGLCVRNLFYQSQGARSIIRRRRSKEGSAEIANGGFKGSTKHLSCSLKTNSRWAHETRTPSDICGRRVRLASAHVQSRRVHPWYRTSIRARRFGRSPSAECASASDVSADMGEGKKALSRVKYRPERFRKSAGHTPRTVVNRAWHGSIGTYI
jgi:hypothetical protein